MSTPFKWPEGKKLAVSLTFDDGLPSQLKFGVPLLDRFNVKATFYINPRGEDYKSFLKPWKDAAERGHEIGNHTLTHPCSCNFQAYNREGSQNLRCLENMSLEDIRADILEAHRRITEVIPGGSRTFAYPCYQTYVGKGKFKKSYVPVVAEIFLAARGWGETVCANSPLTCDLHELWSWPAHRMSYEEMIGLTVKSSYEGRWAIYTFHNINEGFLSVSDYDLSGFLKFLMDHRDKIWVAPVCEVAEHILEERAKLGL